MPVFLPLKGIIKYANEVVLYFYNEGLRYIAETCSFHEVQSLVLKYTLCLVEFSQQMGVKWYILSDSHLFCFSNISFFVSSDLFVMCQCSYVYLNAAKYGNFKVIKV